MLEVDLEEGGVELLGNHIGKRLQEGRLLVKGNGVGYGEFVGQFS